MSQQVLVLAVNVTADVHRALQLNQHRLLQKDLPRFVAELPNLSLRKLYLRAEKKVVKIMNYIATFRGLLIRALCSGWSICLRKRLCAVHNKSCLALPKFIWSQINKLIN